MSIKTFATFAIIVGCFAVLYPKFLHPMVTRLFGLQPKNVHNSKDGGQYYPPGRQPEEKQPSHVPPPHKDGDVRKHMRPGPHPGMRAAAEMHRQQSHHGSGRGMMGIVLPMYAVGIVLYLVYTLVKVFGKKENDLQSEDRYDSSLPNYPPGPSRPSRPSPQSPQQKSKELQDLLMKADDKSISNEEMKELQCRLEETETQMSKILQAMQLVQDKIDPTVHAGKSQEQPRKTPDSSPDMDSYEVVNKSGRSDQQKGGSNATTPDVDNIRPEEVVGQQAPGKPETADTTQEAETGVGETEKGNNCGEVKDKEDRCDRVADDRKENDSEVTRDQEEKDSETSKDQKASGSGVADGQADNGSGAAKDRDVGGEDEVKEEAEEEVILHSSEEEDSDLGSNVRHRQVKSQSSDS